MKSSMIYRAVRQYRPPRELGIEGKLGVYGHPKGLVVTRLEVEGHERFHPLDLEPVIWLDHTDAASLYIDAEGTQPVQNIGDPFALCLNKGSLGSNADSRAPDSASRPIYMGTYAQWDNSQRMDTGGWAPEWGFTVAWSARRDEGGGSWLAGTGANGTSHWAVARGGWTELGNSGRITDGSEFNGLKNGITPPNLTLADTLQVSFTGWVDGTRAWHLDSEGGYADSRRSEAEGWQGRPQPPVIPQGIRLGSVRWTSLNYGGRTTHFFVFDRELSVNEARMLVGWIQEN